ncbi:LysM peptidoglycan-binding domain-containing protein [Pedobacter sp. B4-66]|uniref:CIS tube protein n=1 Tax=Pedobacter sp. B4-66 TaxID=2817280 RepID=UPI001BDA8C4F|nr:LysM peptidoglycan-binding domain-containing protein [Pedobacter sp. B4-66]
MSANYMSGKLEKLLIYSFTDRKFQIKDAEQKNKPAFVAPINPESFTKNFKIEHDVQRPHGTGAAEVKFKSTAPEELKLEFILDGTGTMEGYWAAYKDKPVYEQLKIFMNCAYNYKGDIHRPNFLLIIWGSEIKFRCVLTNLDVNYTLFKPDGTPLRARLTATFLDYQSREERIAEDKPASPDLTHHRIIKQGDRIDLLTYAIYNDPKYFMQVGRANGLTSIKKLKPGNEIYFPPFNKNEV